MAHTAATCWTSNAPPPLQPTHDGHDLCPVDLVGAAVPHPDRPPLPLFSVCCTLSTLPSAVGILIDTCGISCPMRFCIRSEHGFSDAAKWDIQYSLLDV